MFICLHCRLTGMELGKLPPPAAVENLGLPVFPSGEKPTANLSAGLDEGGSRAGSGDTAVDAKKAEGNGKGKEEDYPPFVFSQGFPPVPAKLVGKILRFEFVDMAELLRDNIEADRRKGAQREVAGESQKRSRREVPDILSWIQCFGIYVSVIASKFPKKVPHMLAYQTMVVREARRCGGGGWAAYDTAFQQQAATDPRCDWSQLNSSLYPVTFMAQATGKGKCCAYCLEADHTSDECALSTKPRQERQLRPLSLGLPAHEGVAKLKAENRAGGRPRLRGARSRLDRICYSFNDGECRFPHTCRYVHICQRCHGEDHPACRCPTSPSVRRDGPK